LVEALSIAEAAFKYRLCGDYDGAAKIPMGFGGHGEPQCGPSLEDVLEIQLCFLEQGCLRKAASCLQYPLYNEAEDRGRMVSELVRSSAAAACICGISLYAMCFSSPTGWEEALTLLPPIFYHH
jgi:hypothetical protein